MLSFRTYSQIYECIWSKGHKAGTKQILCFPLNKKSKVIKLVKKIAILNEGATRLTRKEVLFLNMLLSMNLLFWYSNVFSSFVGKFSSNPKISVSEVGVCVSSVNCVLCENFTDQTFKVSEYV